MKEKKSSVTKGTLNPFAMEAKTSFVEKGTLHPPGFIGRLVRLISGVVSLGAVYFIVIQLSVLTSINFPWSSYAFIGLLIFVFIGIHIVFNLGFGLSLGRKPQAAMLILLAAAAGYSSATMGIFDGPAVTTVATVIILYHMSHMGISLILATVLATPGCEMRSIPQLWGILRGNKSKEHYCPGFFDALDKWEYERGARKKTAL